MIKKVLIYENRKSGQYIWDASTPELEVLAFRKLFKVLRKDWQVYNELETAGFKYAVKEYEKALAKQKKYLSIGEPVPSDIEYTIKSFKPNKDHKALFDKAVKGDDKALRQLLEMRVDYEYEEWRLEELQD